MDFKSSLLKGSSLLVLLSLLAACNSNSGESEAEKEAKIAEKREAMQIELAEVSNGECLNLEKYYERLRSKDSDTMARRYTSKFQVRNTGNSLTRNTYLRVAGGNFQIADTRLAEVATFAPMTQADCKTVTFSAEGHKNVYKVVKAKKDSITYESGLKKSLALTTVKWISPTSLEISSTSPVIDERCKAGARADVTVVETITWGDESILTETLPETAIDPNYLALVSEASGYALNTLYSDLSAPVLSPDPNTTPPPEPVIVPPVTPPPPTPEEPVTPGTEQPPVVNPEIPGATSRLEPVTVSDRRLLVNRLVEIAKVGPRVELGQCY